MDIKQRLREHIAKQAVGSVWYQVATDALATIEALEKTVEVQEQGLDVASDAQSACTAFATSVMEAISTYLEAVKPISERAMAIRTELRRAAGEDS